VSLITDFSNIFNDLDPGEIDVSNWNVSNGREFYQMFCGCKNFNSDLSNWKLDNAINCFKMFYGCEKLTSTP